MSNLLPQDSSGMQTTHFVSPALEGKRFDDHLLPLQVFEDFAAYEQFVIELAKWVYYNKNKRKRVPSGFSNVSLKLAGLGEGSTIPAIVMTALSFMVNEEDIQPYYTEARDRITNAVYAADNNANPTDYVPEKYLPYFKDIGKNFKEDEFIDFAPNTNKSAKLNQINRKKIMFSSPAIETVPTPARIRGQVSGVDKAEKTFMISTNDGLRLKSPLPKDFLKIVERSLVGYEEKEEIRVLVSGVGSINRREKIVAMELVESVTILDKLDVPSRLEQFLDLQPGWLDGEGVRFSKTDIDWLGEKFDTVYSSDLILPYTFPEEDGNIQFEWKINEHDATLSLNPRTHEGYYHYYNFMTDQDAERDIKLSTDEEWQELNVILLEHFKCNDN